MVGWEAEATVAVVKVAVETVAVVMEKGAKVVVDLVAKGEGEETVAKMVDLKALEARVELEEMAEAE